MNSGKPYWDCVGDIESSAKCFEYYAGWCDKIQGKTIPVGKYLNPLSDYIPSFFKSSSKFNFRGTVLYIHKTRTCWSVRRHYSMELSHQHDGLEASPSSRMWMHHCSETSRANTSHCFGLCCSLQGSRISGGCCQYCHRKPHILNQSKTKTKFIIYTDFRAMVKLVLLFRPT